MAGGRAPLVSVVVPVYNGAATIGRTIASVLAQTLVDLELVIVNDGSTDETAGIVAAVADPRVRLLTFPNAGLPATRNRGVAAATGEFVAFLDADDLWTPDKLASQVAALRAAPRAALAYSFTDSIDEQDRYLSHGTHFEAHGAVYERLVLFNFLDNGSTPLVRAEALREVGPFALEWPVTADWDMWLRLAFRHEFACVPRVQVLYRVHGGAMSSNVPALEAQSVPVLRAALARLPDTPARRSLERAAFGNLYFYCTSRSLRAARSRSDGVRAARYALRFLAVAPPSGANLAYGATQFAKSLLVCLLPERAWRRAFAWLARDGAAG